MGLVEAMRSFIEQVTSNFFIVHIPPPLICQIDLVPSIGPINITYLDVDKWKSFFF